MLRRRFAGIRILAAVLVGGPAASAVLVGQVRTHRADGAARQVGSSENRVGTS